MALFVLWLAVGLGLSAASAAERLLDFTTLKINEPPPGFRSTVTGEGPPGDWRIILDEVPPLLPILSPNAPVLTKRPVLAQLSTDPTDEHFPLLIYEQEKFRDFTLKTRFKLMSGTVEQMAGVAFRVQDEKNYYVVRASTLGNNLRFYKFVQGLRTAPIGPSLEVPRNQWLELTIECKGNQIRWMLNDKELTPPMTDDTYAEGRIGFWTKSDAVSYFCDTRLTYTPLEPLARHLVREAMQRYPRLLGLSIFSRRGGRPDLHVVASTQPAEIGKAAEKVERDAFERDAMYAGKDGKTFLVTLPLHDRNGDPMAVLRVILKAFPGQTDQNALARALPIAKKIEESARSAKELVD